MAKITLEELSGSLKEYLNRLGLTEAQVQELIDRFEDEKIGDISQLSTSEKGSLVGAINELFQNANNGKQLIANAIGEPLDSNDTFSAMSNDINSLLSTFKTNMMNSGVTVESSDRFKSLIDKIKGLTEGEGKGIRYAEGTGAITVPANGSNVTYNLNIDFDATLVIVRATSTYDGLPSGTNLLRIVDSSIHNSFDTGCILVSGFNNVPICYVQGNSIIATSGVASSYSWGYTLSWAAIGVGEEDTTLRDSLASILQGEGVNVTEEDDMASLITKVDEEFNNKNNEIENSGSLDIISAAELPNEVVNNQIVVITTNTPTDINIKDSSLCSPTTNGEMNIGIVTVPDDSGVPYNITQNNIMMSLYLKVAKERVNNVVNTLNGYTGIGG